MTMNDPLNMNMLRKKSTKFLGTSKRNEGLSLYIPNFRKIWQKDKLFGVRKGARSSHASGKLPKQTKKALEMKTKLKT